MTTEREIDPKRGARIRQIRKELLSQTQDEFAEWVGDVSRGAVGNWELGKEVGLKNLRKISQKAKIPLDWIAYGVGDNPFAANEVVYDSQDPADPEPIDPDAPATWSYKGKHKGIPEDASGQVDVTGGMGGGGVTIISEGVPGKSGMTFSAEVISDYWRLPPALLATLNLKAQDVAIFPVQGNSMSPTLEEGDFVFVDTRHRWPSPDGIYAITDDFGGIVVKRLELTNRPRDEEKTVRIISDNPQHTPKEWSLEDVRIIGRVVRRFCVP